MITTEHRYTYSHDLEEMAIAYRDGVCYDSHLYLGAHALVLDEQPAVRFAVWAPRAIFVNLVGDFNHWNNYDLPMRRISGTDIWTITVFWVKNFDAYKYRIVSMQDEVFYKADPYARHAELRPSTASKFFDLSGFKWTDKRWMNQRRGVDFHKAPISIYEVNLLSWRKDQDGRLLSYEAMADLLVDYVKDMAYSHVAFMPIMEYPFDGSWGYQTSGFFAPTSRFGTPHDFMALVDRFHKRHIGVILDWSPGHFCRDGHGLARFDGTYCYESLDQAKAVNTERGTYNFDFSKQEVQNFLISSALYWLEYYHIDGFRLDGVSYMLHCNSRPDSEGGLDTPEMDFLKKLNRAVNEHFPQVLLIADESTAWPQVTSPIDQGGLGFDFNWNRGWTQDTLSFMAMDPLFRSDHQGKLINPIAYAFSENFLLPLSHDEVAHNKGALLTRMPGDYGDKFKNARLLYAYFYAYPGKKLMFMGDELATFDEWNEWGQLSWSLLNYETHLQHQDFIRQLNLIYKREEALSDLDTRPEGFKWVEHENHDESILIFERIAQDGSWITCIFNFTPIGRTAYPVGVKEKGTYSVLINTDSARYGGETVRNKSYRARAKPVHERDCSILVDIPSYGGLYIKKKK